MYRSLPSAKRLLGVAGAALAGTVLGAGSCVSTDIGAPCQVQTKIAAVVDGVDCRQADVSIEAQPQCFRPSLADFQADQVREGGGRDYVAFGVPVCDNLTCVRSQGEPVPAGNGAASGYCSGECINDDDCQSDAGKFECRALVLDDAFLDGLEQSLSPEEYERYLGRIKTAKYCARVR
jgi:hypothetical protein